ncbi:MAG: SH3 domain-containing protein [Paracoccaceae bacterium]
MLRLTMLTLVGLGLVMTIAGRDLTADEIAAINAAKAEQDAPKAIAREAMVARAASSESTKIATTAAQTNTPEPEGMVLSTKVAALVAPASKPAPAPAAAAAPAAEKVAVKQTVQPILRQVIARRVNVRSGPSTDYEVLDQVVRGEITMVISDPNADWVKIRIEGDGVEGYLAARFLTEISE